MPLVSQSSQQKPSSKPSPIQDKIDQLRQDLETATWEKELDEEQLEDKRLETLYAHGRYLRKTARDTTYFINEIFCKSEFWKVEWSAIGNPLNQTGGTSSMGSSAYEESNKSKIQEDYISDDSCPKSADSLLKDSDNQIAEAESHMEKTTNQSPDGKIDYFDPRALQAKLNFLTGQPQHQIVAGTGQRSQSTRMMFAKYQKTSGLRTDYMHDSVIEEVESPVSC